MRSFAEPVLRQGAAGAHVEDNDPCLGSNPRGHFHGLLPCGGVARTAWQAEDREYRRESRRLKDSMHFKSMPHYDAKPLMIGMPA